MSKFFGGVILDGCIVDYLLCDFFELLNGGCECALGFINSLRLDSMGS